MSRWLVFILLILFSIYPAFLISPANASITQCENLICIHFYQADSTYARQALALLKTAREEINADFLIPTRDTLHVIIAASRSDFRDYVQQGLPTWAHAFAVPSARTMVVRSPRWDRPEASFRQTLVHELLHLVLYEQKGMQSLPRWLDEGLALFYADHALFEKSTTLSKALATGSLIPLQQIDDVLQFEKLRADLAYQESHSAVRYLLATYDIDALRQLVTGLRKGEDLDTVFIKATGSSFAAFELEWKSHLEVTEKWYWLTEIDELIWIGVPFLSILTFLAIRWRNRKTVAQWKQDELQQETMKAEADVLPPEVASGDNESVRNIY